MACRLDIRIERRIDEAISVARDGGLDAAQ